MKRALVMLLASCTLDPVSMLNHAALEVKVVGLSAGGKVVLTSTDAAGASRVKRTPVSAEEMTLFYEEGSLADGPVFVAAELFDGAGVLLGCGLGRGVAGGEDNRVLIGFASPSNNALNCGTCGTVCETELASGQCVNGQCTNYECVPGYESEGDGGCREAQGLGGGAGGGGGGGGGSATGGGAAGGTAGGSGGGDSDAGTGGGSACTGTTAETTEALCSDGADNDCNTRTDCAEPGCNTLTRGCTLTTGCRGPGTQTWSCATRMWGACTGDAGTAETTIALCRDGVDNDCNGKKDCGDDACNDIRDGCGVDVCAAGIKLWICATGLYGLCLPYIPLPENNNLLCGNGSDDDCDGKKDCIDTGCRGRACGGGNLCCADGGCAPSCQ